MSEARANGWVFGPTLDFAAFTGPILLSLFFSLLVLSDVSFTQGRQYYFAFNIFFNVAHVYSTFWYTYTSPDQWKRHGTWFVAIPLIFFAVNLGIGFGFSNFHLLSFFSHFSVWHFIKQQQAWFHIAASRGLPRDKVTTRIDQFALHGITWGFMIASQSNDSCRGWFLPGDIIEFYDWLFMPVLVLSLLVILIYVIRHSWLFIKGHPTNWAAHHIMACALVIWGYARLAPTSPLTFHFIQLHHAIPYLILGARYFNSEWKTKTFLLPRISFPLTCVGIYLIDAVVGKLEMGMRNELGFLWNQNDVFDFDMGVLGFSLWNALSLTHYMLDAIIWNRKHNPDWTKALGN